MEQSVDEAIVDFSPGVKYLDITDDVADVMPISAPALSSEASLLASGSRTRGFVPSSVVPSSMASSSSRFEASSS